MAVEPVKRSRARAGNRIQTYQLGIFQDVSTHLCALVAKHKDAQWGSAQQNGRWNDREEVLFKSEGEVEVLTTASDDRAERGVIAGWRRHVHGGRMFDSTRY